MQTQRVPEPVEETPGQAVPVPQMPGVRDVQTTAEAYRDAINALIDLLSGRGAIPEELALTVRMFRSGDWTEAPDINAFANGTTGSLVLEFDPSNDRQLREIQIIIDKMALLNQEYAEQLQYLTPPPSYTYSEAPQPLAVSPGQAGPFSFIMEEGKIRLFNNRFVPFSTEEREQVKRILEAALGMDEHGMSRVLELIDMMAEVATKSHILDVRRMQRSDNAEISDALADARDAYQLVLAKLMEEGRALTGIAQGSADALHLAVQGLAEEADRVYGQSLDRIAGVYSGREVSDIISYVKRIMSVSGEMGFSDFEKGVFENFEQQFQQIALQMRQLSRRFAELDMAPNLESQELTPAEKEIFRNFLSLAGAFELFRAKARFVEIYRQVLESYNLEHYPGSRGPYPPISGEEMESLLMELDRFGPEVSSYGRMDEELAELQDQLDDYGRVMEEAVVQAVANSLLDSSVPEAERINLDQLTEQGRGFLSNLREHREGLTRSHGQTAFGGMLHRYANYFRMFEVDTNSLIERSEKRVDEAAVSLALEHGDIPSLLYESSRYFLKYHGTEFTVAVTVLSAGFGAIGGGIARGVTGLVEVGSAAARGGYAVATAVTAVPAAIVAGHALYDFARGEWGDRSYQDLDIASGFLMMASMGWAGGTRLGARLFSTATAGLGTAGITAHMVEAIDRGDSLGATSDAVAIAVGGMLFVKGITGIRSYRLAQPLPEATARFSTPFGLRDVQLPNVWSQLAFPYTATGITTMFGGMAGITALIAPDQVAQMIESGGFEEYRAWLNQQCAEFTNEGPIFMLGFHLLGTPARLWRLASGEGGFRAAARTVVRNAALGDRAGMFVEIPVGEAGGEAASVLMLASSDPGRTFAALQAGAGSSAIDIAARYGANLGDQEFFHRLMIAALGDTRMTAREMESFFAELSIPREFRRQLRQFSEELYTSLTERWQAADALLSGGEISASQQQLFLDAQQMARRSASEARVAAGTTAINVGLVAGGAVRVALAVPEADAVLALNQHIMQLESDKAALYFFNEFLRRGPTAGTEGIFPGLDRAFTLVDLKQSLEEIGMTLQSIEDESLWYSDRLKNLFPSEYERFCLVYACAISILTSNTPEMGQLEMLVGDVVDFVEEARALGLDFSEMKPSDFFLLANLVRRAGPEGINSVISDMQVISNSGNFSADTMADPQFARVLLAALYYKSENLSPENQDWLINAVYHTYFNLVDVLTGSSEQIARLHGEMMVTMFDQNEFRTVEDMQALNKMALIDLWMRTWEMFPAQYYSPPPEDYNLPSY